MADRELTEDEVADLKEAFAMFDINGDGRFQVGCRILHYNHGGRAFTGAGALLAQTPSARSSNVLLSQWN